jgi:hypothetical protein
VVYHEYEVELPTGPMVSLAITLGDLKADNLSARFARENKALAYGLVSILEMPNAPTHPIVWMVDDYELSLATEEDDPSISEEVEELVQLYLRLFFIQTAPIAPQLAGIEVLSAVGANDHRTLH